MNEENNQNAHVQMVTSREEGRIMANLRIRRRQVAHRSLETLTATALKFLTFSKQRLTCNKKSNNLLENLGYSLPLWVSPARFRKMFGVYQEEMVRSGYGSRSADNEISYSGAATAAISGAAHEKPLTRTSSFS
jgi:hypothetical protein